MTIFNHIFKITLASLCLLHVSMALAGQPRWIAEPSFDYPSDRYLIGTGIGSTSDEAQNRARGVIATIFEVRIAVVNESTISVAQSGKNEQIDRLSTQQVSAKTDKVISGINIAEVWRDPVTQDFYALATLSRAQASASLQEELSKIDDEVQQRVSSAKTTDDALLKIAALTQALEASIKRDGFQASLKVVDPSGRGVKANISQASIQTLIGNALKSIKISPEVAEDGGSREFAGLLKGGLAAAGFLASSPAQADLLLVGKLTLTDLGRKENWNWMRGTVEVSLVEKSTGRVRGSKTWPVKASAQDAKTAKSRTLIEIEKLLKEELRAAVIEFAAS
jgi:hypothetical protein